jgi:hypothetical protein
MKRTEAGTMRTLHIAAACLTLFAIALALRPTTALADCAAVRSSCIDHCRDSKSDQSRFQACANRCSTAFCQDIPIACRPGDQRVCSDGFTSCTGGCDALAAIPTAAAIQNQTACQSRCCTQFKVCLRQRDCAVGRITCQ